MYYLKLKAKNTTIEFANDWLGVERIYANGQLVSQQTSVLGSTHRFTVMEDGHLSRYALIVRLNMRSQVIIDLNRDREVLYEGVVAKYGSKPASPSNKEKKLGILQLREYDIPSAIELLEKALEVSPKDPEIYFYLACAFSIAEKAEDGYEALKTAVSLGLQDLEVITQHDQLAYLRLQDAFESFFESGYTAYDKGLLNLKQ